MITNGDNIISHDSHPQHNLKYEDTEIPFRCDGCKEIGIGKRYTCAACNFDLHKHCGVDPHTPLVHQLMPKGCNNLKFCLRPPENTVHYCNACRKPVTGFLYRCERCDFDLHPCCANLPMELEDGGVKLKLIEKEKKWIYRSRCKKYKMEVAKARDVIESSTELLLGSTNISNRVQTGDNRGMMRRSLKTVGFALRIVISALLGDPTSLIIAVIASFMRPS